jgi:putative two-component system response regulator
MRSLSIPAPLPCEKNSPTVLIIDDTPMVIFSLSRMLLPLCSVKVSRDGDEGLKLAEENEIALILLDLYMPEISGFEVLRRLKENKKTRNIPVVLISGSQDAEDEQQGYSLGATGFIKKPFDEKEVPMRIAKYIFRRGTT